MFTGIISELGVITGRVDEDQLMRITVRAPATCDGLAVGDSVAVNGVCLTATAVTDGNFTLEAVAETLERTSLGSVELDEPVNLERPLPASGRYDGHMVQGHVDGVATVLSVQFDGASQRIRLALPDTLGRYVVEKGSIALDGASLTITAVSAPNDASPWIEVVLIPHTIDATALGTRVPGDRVNVETDILAKYIERLTETNR